MTRLEDENAPTQRVIILLAGYRTSKAESRRTQRGRSLDVSAMSRPRRNDPDRGTVESEVHNGTKEDARDGEQDEKKRTAYMGADEHTLEASYGKSENGTS